MPVSTVSEDEASDQEDKDQPSTPEPRNPQAAFPFDPSVNEPRMKPPPIVEDLTLPEDTRELLVELQNI